MLKQLVANEGNLIRQAILSDKRVKNADVGAHVINITFSLITFYTTAVFCFGMLEERGFIV